MVGAGCLFRTPSSTTTDALTFEEANFMAVEEAVKGGECEVTGDAATVSFRNTGASSVVRVVQITDGRLSADTVFTAEPNCA